MSSRRPEIYISKGHIKAALDAHLRAISVINDDENGVYDIPELSEMVLVKLDPTTNKEIEVIEIDAT